MSKSPRLCLADLRFLPAHDGMIESCSACGQNIRHGHACAVAVLRIIGKDGLPARQNWGLLICSHCRNLPQEKLVRAIFHRALATARQPDAVPSAFERSLLLSLQ